MRKPIFLRVLEAHISATALAFYDDKLRACLRDFTHQWGGGGGRNRKSYLIIGIIFNISLLGFFKYSDFFLQNLNIIPKLLSLDFSFPLPHIVLPLALLQQIAFLVDCYKKKLAQDEGKLSFIDYALFISFFPQLIAGPIVHHKEMIPQFHALKNRISWDYVARGMFIFSIRLFKKVVIADNFATWDNAGFKATLNGKILNTLESWATSLSYTFQLYFDFSGYCDMAMGLGLLFGIMLPLNFNSPYKSLNISEFWRRWHITLGRFFRDYVYIPLGGNQNRKYTSLPFYIVEICNGLQILTLWNLFIVAFLSGIWHGAGWGFVIWGILHGTALCAHRIYQHCIESYKSKLDSRSLFLRFLESRFYKFACFLLTFNFINIAWIFFRSESLSSASNLLKSMFHVEFILPKFLQSHIGFLHLKDVEFGKWASVIEKPDSTICSLLGAFIICLFLRNTFEKSQNPSNAMFALAGVVFVFSVCALGSYTSPFLYFNF